MARYTKIVENRAKMLTILVDDKREKLIQKLSELKGVTSFKPRTLSIFHSPIVSGIIPPELLELYSDYIQQAEYINYDKKPNDFVTDLRRFLQFKPEPTPDNTPIGAQNKEAYTQVFLEYGYQLVTNDTPIFGKKGQFNEICNFFKEFYLVLESDKYKRTSSGASSNIMALSFRKRAYHYQPVYTALKCRMQMRI